MSAVPTYCFIINCSSNSNRSEIFFKEREEELRQQLPGKTEFIYVRKDESISNIAEEKATTYSHIVACGGDGTVNRVANALIDTSAVLGVIPLGSGNDFAQNIGLSLNFDEDIKILLENNVTPVDAIQTDWGYFINTFGIGIDGLTNYYSGKSSFKHGRLKYFWAGLRALFESKPFKVTISAWEMDNSIERTTWMVAIANGKTEGGKYKISPGSVNYDGEVELIIVNAVPKWRIFFEFIKLSLGYSFKESLVEVIKTEKEFEVKTKAILKIHADGEQVHTMNHTFPFSVHKAALKVVTNKYYQK